MAERKDARIKEPPKEKKVRQPISQFSMAIACLEEGQYIDRMMGVLRKQTLPQATDFLVVISDNGSRGTWSIIEPESVLTAKRQALERTLGEKGLGTSFLTVLQEEEKARNLSLTASHQQELQQTLAKRNSLFFGLQQALPEDTQQQLAEYVSLEDAQRSLLADTVSQPKQQIEKADAIRPPRVPDQLPTTEQQETLAAYARIFLGAYDNPEKDFRIAIVQGSETGSFGSVKRFGLEAVKKDFLLHHPDTAVSEHIVMIGDMDSDIDTQFAGNVVDAFAKNGDKNALLAKPYPADEIKKRNGTISLKRNRLVPPPLPTMFMDITNMRSFIREQKRQPGEFLPAGYGKTELFRYHLHPGPALIFRGDVLEGPEPLILQTDGQGEDIAATFRYQRRYGSGQTITDVNVGYGFNMRGHEMGDYVKQFVTHPVRFTKGIASGRVRELVVPYQHQKLEQVMGEKSFRDFLQGINGYMQRKTLLGRLIREADEQTFPQLTHTDFIVFRSPNIKDKILIPNAQKGERIIPGFNPITGKNEYALVRSASPALHIHPDEYVNGQITEEQEQRILRKRSFGERTEGISIIDKSGREIPVIYHIQKKLEEKPITDADIIFAETLSTHNGRARRLSSITK